MLSKFFKPILLQRPFCMIAGGILGGLLLTQACVYEDMANSRGLFVPRTYVQWEKDTGMTRKEIDAALAIVVEQGLLETKEDKPEILRFRVKHEVVDAKLAGIGEVVEPEKKEAIAEQLHLPVVVPEEPSQIVVSSKAETKPKKSKRNATDRLPEDLEIDRVFLPLYLEHKVTRWTVHEKIPTDSLKAIKALINEYPDDAPQRFIDALTWSREGDGKGVDWCREAQYDLDNLCTKSKLFRFSEAHRTAIENDSEYVARVEGRARSRDIKRAAPGIDKSQIAQGQQALNNYMETPRTTISQEEWDAYA